MLLIDCRGCDLPGTDTHVLRAILAYLCAHLCPEMQEKEVKDFEGRSIGKFSKGGDGETDGEDEGEDEGSRCDAAQFSAMSGAGDDIPDDRIWARLRSDKQKLITNVLDQFRLAHFARSEKQFQVLRKLIL